jgi:hypothetical protein
MAQDYVDDHIRQKLEQAEVPYEASDWEVMLESLEENFFDAPLREAVSNYALPAGEADWESLERSMNASEFDGLIAGKLVQLDTASLPGDWDAMSAQLNAAGFDALISDKLLDLQPAYQTDDWDRIATGLGAARFDSLLRNKFRLHETPFRAADWRLMAQSLRKPAILRNWMIASAALFLLLFGGTFALRSLLLQPGSDQPAPKGISGPITPAAPSTVTIEKPEPHDIINTDGPPSKTMPFAISPHKEQFAVAVPPEVKPSENTAFTFQAEAIDSRIPAWDLAAFDKPLSPEKLFQEVPPLTSVPVSDELFGLETALPLLETMDHQLLPGYPPLTISGIPGTKMGVRIGTFSSILTSASELNEKGTRGFASGIRLQLRLNEAVSIVSGLLYSEKHFRHTYHMYSASLRTFYENLLVGDFKMLEVPILLRYETPISSRLTFYVQGGASAMINLLENYQHYDQSSFSNLEFLPVPTTDALPYLQPTDQKLGFSTYVGNIHIAPGLEYQLKDRFSLFIEPYAQYGLQKMGTPEKRLHSAGIGLGFNYDFAGGGN